LFRLHAHDKAVSALDINANVRGCIVTGSTDGAVKVWDVKENRPSMVTSRNVKSDIGQVFSITFCPDSPFNLAMAGSAGKVNIWDIATNGGVRRAFEGRSTIVASANTETEKVVALENDDEPESEEDMDGADIDMDEVAESDYEEESGDDV
jgi:periodic tryptophan protein 1